ncbi:hypothetical protein TNCV_1983151 [Trichonephila clavipes]|nr:hypothetical protein TNCV_1983151 [Trichonephila clavipes]
MLLEITGDIYNITIHEVSGVFEKALKESCRLGRFRENGIIEHRWCDGQGCPDVGQELWRSWSRRPGCVFVCYARMGLGRLRDFCGLPMRRDEGRVVDSPWCVKRVFLENERRTLDQENLRRALKKGGPRLKWKGRKEDERRWRWRIGAI